MVFQLQDSNETFSGKDWDRDANKGFFQNIADKVFIAPDDKQIALVDKYNLAVENGTKAKKKFLSTFDDKDPLKSYFTTLDGGIATQKGMTGALNKTTIASKAATLGMKALSVAGNMLVFALVSKVISVTVEAVSNYIRRNEIAIEKTNELTSAWKAQKDALQSNKKTIDDISESYKNLAQGVDQFGNNISLTSDEYKQYNDIVTKIADMFPHMVQGYNEQDIAILKHKGNIEELTKALDEQAKSANRAIIADGQDAFDGFKAQSSEYQKELEDIRKAMAFMNGESTYDGKDFGDKWKQSDFFEKRGLETSVWDLSFNGNGSNNSINLDYGSEEERNQKQIVYNQLLLEEQGILKNIAGEKLKPNSVIQAFLDLQTEFVALEDPIKDITSLLSSSLDIKDFDHNATKMQAYIKSNILKPIYENKDNIQSGLEEVLSVDFSKLNISEVVQFEEKLKGIQKTLGLDDEAFVEFKIGLGINEDIGQIDRLKSDIQNLLGDDMSVKVFNNLNFSDLQEFDRQLKQIAEDKGNVTEYAKKILEWKSSDQINTFLEENKKLLEEGKLSYSSYNKKLEEFANKLGLTGNVYSWFIGLFKQELPPMPDLNPIIDNYQEKIKSTEAMLEKLKNGSLTNDEVMDFMQENPNLDWSSIDFGSANFGNLKEVLEKEAEEGIYQGTMNSIEDSYGALESRRKEVQNNYDSSEKADADLKALEDENQAIDRQLVLLDKRKSYIENDHKTPILSIPTLEEANKNLDDLQTKYQSLSSAIEDYNLKGYMTIDNLQSVIALGYDYVQYLSVENGQLQMNKDGMVQLALARIDDAEAAYLQEATKTLKTFEDEAAAADFLKSSLEGLSGARLADAQAAYTQAISIALKGGAGAARDAANALNESVIKGQTLFNSARSSVGKYTNSVMGASSANKALTDALNKQKDALEDQKDALEKQKTALEDQKAAIEKNKDAQDSALKAINKLLDDEIEKLEEQKTLLSDPKVYGSYGQRIQALQDERDALNAVNEEKDRQLAIEKAQMEINKAQIELEKAQLAFENAKKQKNFRVYYEDKGWYGKPIKRP